MTEAREYFAFEFIWIAAEIYATTLHHFKHSQNEIHKFSQKSVCTKLGDSHGQHAEIDRKLIRQPQMQNLKRAQHTLSP